VPKTCNAYEENVAKWTQNKEFSQNDAQHSNKSLLKIYSDLAQNKLPV
jgi:hypothetical protein